jgi:hypothetical protein
MRSVRGEVLFSAWEVCETQDECNRNDWARLVLSLNALRWFGVVKSVREIIYSFYVILPNYSDIMMVTFLVIYFYAVWGCIVFGGWFKYLNNYDLPQANFNSFLDAFTTLLQLFVGEAWNSVMMAGWSTAGENSATVFFLSYVILTTLLLTNLLVGVIISGYGSVVEVQREAQRQRVSRLPTKLIRMALTEGEIKEHRVKFTYTGSNEIQLTLANHGEGTEGLTDAKATDKSLSEAEEIMRMHKTFTSELEKTKEAHGFYTEESMSILADTAYRAVDVFQRVEKRSKQLALV